MMKLIQNEALFEKPFSTNHIAITDKDADDNYTLIMTQQKRNRKQHEMRMKFTQNGMNALLGSWMAQTGNFIPEERHKDD